MKKYIMIFIFFITINSITNGQNWQSLRGGIDWMGVRNMFEDTIDKVLYVVGGFKTVDYRNIRGIAKWNGTKWDSLGVGMDADQGSFPENTLAVCRYNNEIYAGGAFYNVGGINTRFLAKWDGTKWDSLSSNVNGSVDDLKVYNNKLYVGGIFTDAEGIPVNSLAIWDGNNWSSLGFPLYGAYIYAICEYKGELYIGGNFNSSAYPNDSIQNIIRYDGNNWKSVGGGLHGGMDEISSMVVYKNELYVAGTFTAAHGNPGNYIAKWNGNQWSDVGGGVLGMGGYNGQIFDLCVYNDELYAGGVFSYAGGIPANKIAKWDGTNWCSLGSIIHTTVTSLCSFNNMLIIGGGFDSIDGDSINSIAKWTGGSYVSGCGNTSGIQEFNNNENDLSIYPNPTAGTFTMMIEQSEKADAFIKIYNINGSLIYSETLKNQFGLTTKQLDISNFSKGLYLIKVDYDNKIVTKKIIKQ